MDDLVELGRKHPGSTPPARVAIVNPPALPGRTNERTYSGGIGVSRRLKPWERESPEVPPIDLLYLAAVAEAHGATVKIVDLLPDRLKGDAAFDRCVDALVPVRAPGAWVGVRLSMPSLEQDLAFAERLTSALPECRVFVFGSVILATLDHWVKRTRVRWVLFGEAEAVFGGVLDAPDPARAPGVVVPARYVPLSGDDLYDEGAVARERRRWVKVEDLAALPRPAWHLLDLARYSPSGAVADVGVYVQASRGCPIGCTMCPYALLEGTHWRHNDVERVAGEIEYLNRRFGITHVRFRDPNFGFSRRYARELARMIVERGLRVEATIESSVEVFDEETLRLLRAAGIRTITTGVETDDAACMDSIGQSLRVNDKIRDRVRLCHELGFHVYGTYCLGTPEETWDTVEKTIRLARELDVESGFTVMTPFPGTPMYFRALREGLLPRKMQFSRWNSYSATVRSYALSTTDLDVARWWARLETILPYRRRRVAPGDRRATLQFYARHAPHYAVREACRAYVALRRRLPTPAIVPAREPRVPASVAAT